MPRLNHLAITSLADYFKCLVVAVNVFPRLGLQFLEDGLLLGHIRETTTHFFLCVHVIFLEFFIKYRFTILCIVKYIGK